MDPQSGRIPELSTSQIHYLIYQYHHQSQIMFCQHHFDTLPISIFPVISTCEELQSLAHKPQGSPPSKSY